MGSGVGRSGVVDWAAFFFEVALVNRARWVKVICQCHDSTTARMKMAYHAALVTPWAGVSSVYCRFGALQPTEVRGIPGSVVHAFGTRWVSLGPEKACVAYLRPRLVSIAATVCVWRPWLMSAVAIGVWILRLPVFLRFPVLVPRVGTSPVLACPALIKLVLLLLLLPPVPSSATSRRATSSAHVVARAETGETPLST